MQVKAHVLCIWWNNELNFKIVGQRAPKRAREPVEENFTYQRNKLQNTVNLNIQNRFGILNEQILHDKSVLQAPLTSNKRVIIPKINVISIKVLNTIAEALPILE